MRFNWARTAPMLLVLLVGLLSGCPEPDVSDTPIRKRPSATPTLGGTIGGATPTPGTGSSATPTTSGSPAGGIDSTFKTPTPVPTPSPTPTLAPLVTPVPVVTQPPPSATPEPLPSDPVGQR